MGLEAEIQHLPGAQPGAQVPAAPRRSSGRLRALSITVWMFSSLFLVELALRTRAYVRTGHFGQAHALELDQGSGLLVPVRGRSGRLRNDSRGFRSPELEQPKPPGRVRFAFLGGSTTYCAEVSDLEKTWPALVIAGLRREFPSADVDWVNAGVAGYASKQSILNLEHRVAPLEPDVLVIMHATNDLTQLTADLAAEQGLVSPPSPLAWLTERSFCWFIVEKNLRFLHRRNGAGEPPLLSYELDTLAEGFRRSLGDLVRQGKREAQLVALLTFSQRSRTGQDPGELRANAGSSLYYMPYMTPEGLRDAFARFNGVIRQVAADERVLLVDGDEGIPADAEHFVDSVHLTERGSEKQAERVLQSLLEDERLRRLLEGPSGG